MREGIDTIDARYASGVAQMATRFGISIFGVMSIFLAMLATGFTAIASADPVPVEHTYAPGSPDWDYENDIAVWTGHVTYSSGKTMAWSIQLKPSVQAIVYGGSMTCRTTIIDLPNYLDYHPNIPASYLLHSSVGNLHDGHQYRLRSVCDFQVLTDTGLVPGNVQTSVNFRV